MKTRDRHGRPVQVAGGNESVACERVAHNEGALGWVDGHENGHVARPSLQAMDEHQVGFSTRQGLRSGVRVQSD